MDLLNWKWNSWLWYHGKWLKLWQVFFCDGRHRCIYSGLRSLIWISAMKIAARETMLLVLWPKKWLSQERPQTQCSGLAVIKNKRLSTLLLHWLHNIRGCMVSVFSISLGVWFTEITPLGGRWLSHEWPENEVFFLSLNLNLVSRRSRLCFGH